MVHHDLGPVRNRIGVRFGETARHNKHSLDASITQGDRQPKIAAKRFTQEIQVVVCREGQFGYDSDCIFDQFKPNLGIAPNQIRRRKPRLRGVEIVDKDGNSA